MKVTLARSLIAIAIAPLPFAAHAEETLSLNIGVVSLYKSGGVDQNTAPKDNKSFYPALQGGADFDFGNGLYIGNWNSTGRFENASLEIDVYGGFKGKLSEELSYDVGFTRSMYPRQSDWNSSEFYIGFTHGAAGLTISRGTTFDSNRGDMSYAFSYEFSLTDALGLTLSYGVHDITRGNGNDDFEDYAVGLSYDLGDDLSVWGTLSGATHKASNPDRKNRLTFGVLKGY